MHILLPVAEAKEIRFPEDLARSFRLASMLAGGPRNACLGSPLKHSDLPEAAGHCPHPSPPTARAKFTHEQSFMLCPRAATLPARDPARYKGCKHEISVFYHHRCHSSIFFRAMFKAILVAACLVAEVLGHARVTSPTPRAVRARRPLFVVGCSCCASARQCCTGRVRHRRIH